MNKRYILQTMSVIFAVSLIFTGSVYAAQVDVTPSSMGTWAFDARFDGGTGVGAMVTGPTGQPLGTGSANLIVGNGTIGGDGTEEIRSTGFVGLRLDAITSLSYYAYSTLNNGQQFPYLGLTVDTDGIAGADDILFFEPPYQTPATGNATLPDQGTPVNDTWQFWNARDGGWWSNTGFGGSGGTNVLPLNDYISLHPDATIVNADSGLGGIRFNVGFASDTDRFNGNVDAFTIGTAAGSTTFNFDPDGAAPGVPEPATILLLGSGLAGLAVWGRRKNRQV